MRRAMPFLAAHAAGRALRDNPAESRIELTLDRRAQEGLERVAREAAQRLGPRLSVAMVLADAQTGDILAEVAASRPRPFVVGFAAETTDMEGYARGKLERKGLDMIAGNRVGLPGSGFEADENAFTVLWPGGREELASAPKAELARQLLRLVCTRMAAGAAA